MLEHSQLLVHGWTKQTLADGAAWVRPIADAAGRSLGFVRLEGPAAGSWFSWLRKTRLDVFETDDASHLLTLTRSWGVLRTWEVDDAEGRHVGTIYTKNIVSSEGARLALLDAAHGRIVDPSGRALARYTEKPSAGLELTFAPTSSANPFLRMLLLASVLTLAPTPIATG